MEVECGEEVEEWLGIVKVSFSEQVTVGFVLPSGVVSVEVAEPDYERVVKVVIPAAASSAGGTSQCTQRELRVLWIIDVEYMNNTCIIFQ